jgi:uncharacterized membrane protein YwzB
VKIIRNFPKTDTEASFKHILLILSIIIDRILANFLYDILNSEITFFMLLKRRKMRFLV